MNEGFRRAALAGYSAAADSGRYGRVFRGGLVWAVNVGGTACSASDGAPHEAESSLPNGRNNRTFHFAEPEDSAPGQRVFDAFAEGRRVEEDGWNAWPCDHPFHLNPNVAVGGA